MNETRNIIAGLEIGKEQSQLCYFDRKEREPISVSVKAGSNQYLFPTLLSRSREKRPGTMAWKLIIFPGRRERSQCQDFLGSGTRTRKRK